MPILCPGAGSLWRLGKHSRHGGQRSNSRHSTSGSRPVNARGTFTQKQVDVGPSMSPSTCSSTGGVYMGPEKKVKVSSTTTTSSSAQDKKLADIRSPTDYYTDGNVFIGQDVTKNVELDTHNSSEHSDILHPMRSEQTHHNDTLNPDGTLASIVFFEETFMSAKFSHLTTNSPGCTANRSRVLDTTTTSLPNQSGLQEKRGCGSTIPSWVRQRRCLPTLDEVDFDQIDLISLHSLPTNEQTRSPDGPNGVRNQTVTDANDQTSIVNDPVNNNWVNFTEQNLMAQPRSQKQRSVLGDLTNTDNSPVPKGASKVTNQSAFYKIPKRVLVRERRSRRNRRTSNNRKVKPSSSRESLVNALDKPNEHTYVNLDYIAGIMTNSPSKDDSKKMNESIHDYENVWSNSPVKSTAVQRRMKYLLESDGQSRMSPSVNNTAKRNVRLSQNRRKSDQGQRPDLCVGLPSMTPSPRITPVTPQNSQNVQGALKNYMMGIKETIKGDGAYKKKTLSSTSSWESATDSHSTEGDECAAILYGGAKNKTSHQQHASGTNQEKKLRQTERRDRNYNDTVGRNGNVFSLNRHISDKKNDYVPVDSDTKRLVETPSFVDNAIRKAKIVRTNSTEESSKEEQDVSAKSKTSYRHTEFKPKNSSQIESRRSLPAPSTLNGRSLQKTEPSRSTTNVREVEANLSQKQNRKIRRTIEGDEILKALLGQDKSEPTSNQQDERKTNVTFSDLRGASRSGDEMSRVQKIIEDWNKSSERIAQRHGSTCYVGGHIHTTSTSQLPDQKPSQSGLKDRSPHTNSGLKWMKGARKNNYDGNKAGNRPIDPRTIRTEVNQSSIRRIPTTYYSLTKTQGRRSTSQSVVEVYVTTQAYSPGEVDEIDTQRGEIVVVNSAMQREHDWMWVYVPRSDRFGYLPAFAARPLEFQVNEV